MRTPKAIVLAVAPDQDVVTSAVRFAASEARLRGLPLEVLSAYLGRAALNSSSAHPAFDVRRRRSADDVVRGVLGMPELIGLDVYATVIDGDPEPVLLEASQRAAMLVIGSRELSVFGAFVHRSIEGAVVSRAACPVVVMGGLAGDPREGAGILAGIDGGPTSADVLECAFDFASRHRVPLTVALCWHPDLLATMQWRPEQPAPEKVHRWLAEALAGWSEQYPDVDVRRSVARDHVVEALTVHAGNPYLVVVGRSAEPLSVFGLSPSVHRAVLYRSTRPVVVVPARESSDGGEPDSGRLDVAAMTGR